MKLFGRPAFEKDPRWQLANWRSLNPERSSHYVAVEALKKMRDEVGKAALAELIKVQPGPGGDAFNIDHMAGEIRWRIKSFNLGADVMAITALLGIVETDDYREAAKQIEPLLKAVAELDAKEEAERIARQRAEANLSLAREAAKARALENVDNDAAVISARERLREVQSLPG
jgi:hypothetical protein